MLTKRLLVATTSVLFAFAMLAGPALAHHKFGELPERNPHNLGIPQELWEEGTELAAILGSEFFAVLDDDLTFDQVEGIFEFWVVFRVGEDDENLGAVWFENFEPTEEVQEGLSLDELLKEEALVDPETGDPVVEGTDEGDFQWVLIYPHPHHIILHASTPRERCVDLANERDIGNPNQHNAVHIGTAGHETAEGFSNAGHQIHEGTCAEAEF